MGFYVVQENDGYNDQNWHKNVQSSFSVAGSGIVLIHGGCVFCFWFNNLEIWMVLN